MTTDAPATILVVDDNADNRALFGAYLEAEGHRTLQAETGEQALEMVRARRPDLVLLDVMLPGMSGFDVCQRLKQDPATMATPVIMVTTLEDSHSRTRAFEADADEFLSKPVHRPELVARVRSTLRLRHALRAVEEERRRHLQSLLERYVSKQVAARLINLPEAERDALLNLKQRLDVAIMFTDVRRFTAMSNALESDEVVGILNAHFNDLTRAAHRHGGIVLAMTGDGLLIAFGVPIGDLAEGAAAIPHAVRAALEMQTEFRALADDVRSRHGLQIGLGIGISFGPAIVGNVGSEEFLSFTAIGDTVNIAARIQALAESGTIVVTEPVRAAARELLEALPVETLEDVALRGRTQNMTLYRLRVV